MSGGARSISTELLHRALAVELGHIGVESSVAELATPDYLMGQVRRMTRGLTRNECLQVIAHLAMLTRGFAAEVPVSRRDQMFAELDHFDEGLSARRKQG